MKYRALISDLDGTLLDTLKDLADSVNHVLAQSGFPIRSLDEYRQFVGDGRRPLAMRALPEEQRTDEMIDLFAARIGDEYARRLFNTTRPYDGITEMLDALVERGVRIAVLTNKPQDTAEMMLVRLLHKYSFEVIAGENADTPRKPNPTGALRIARRMDLDPHEFVFLGDSGIDMLTANAAGMYAAGALWGFRDRDELVATGAKVLLHHPTELVSLFDSG
ncbi:MAG TPA: HAD family hydrolase [Dehalococcoidia bacterium]|nr:HAD family hydrolase [Dehalococcoidia bacterium]